MHPSPPAIVLRAGHVVKLPSVYEKHTLLPRVFMRRSPDELSAMVEAEPAACSSSSAAAAGEEPCSTFALRTVKLGTFGTVVTMGTVAVPPSTACGQVMLGKTSMPSAVPSRLLPPVTVSVNLSARPCVLPPEFQWVRTPSKATNVPVKATSSKIERRCDHNGNFWVLVAGPEYAPIIGRMSRVADQPEFYFLTPLFLSYAIRIPIAVLDRADVKFYPVFVDVPDGVKGTPAAHNYYARRSERDWALPNNQLPEIPPGWSMEMSRLPGDACLTTSFVEDEHGLKRVVLSSKTADHPIVRGDVKFDLKKELPRVARDALQGGSMLFLRICPAVTRDTEFVLYTRAAFGEVSDEGVQAAVQFALDNSPRASNGLPWVALAPKPVSAAEVSVNTRVIVAPAASMMEDVCIVDVEEEVLRLLLLSMDSSSYDRSYDEARYRLAVFKGDDVPSTRAYTAAQLDTIRAEVAAAYTKARQLHEGLLCSSVLHMIAPPDTRLVSEVRVHALRFVIKELAPGPLAPKIAADLATRLALDMMWFAPGLAVVSTRLATCFRMCVGKAPGMLSVNAALKGVPQKSTQASGGRTAASTTPILAGFKLATVHRDYPELPVGEPPEFTPEQAADNPMFQMYVRGNPRPTDPNGFQLSVYAPGCLSTILTGTSHSYPVFGEVITRLIYEPCTPEKPFGLFGPEVTSHQRDMAMATLCPTLYNSAGGQIGRGEAGAWNTPGRIRYTESKAYGVDGRKMGHAMGIIAYPAWASEAISPRCLDIYLLKARAMAWLFWCERFGRLIRHPLDNCQRKIREDVTTMYRNCVLDPLRQLIPSQISRPVPIDKSVVVSVFRASQTHSMNILLGTQRANVHVVPSKPRSDARKRRRVGDDAEYGLGEDDDDEDEDEEDIDIDAELAPVGDDELEMYLGQFAPEDSAVDVRPVEHHAFFDEKTHGPLVAPTTVVMDARGV